MLLAAAVCACSPGDGVEWKKATEAGNAALKEDSFERAEEAFVEAVRLAQNFAPQDPRAKLARENLASVRWVRNMDKGMAFFKDGDFVRAEPLVRAAVGFAGELAESMAEDFPGLETSLAALAVVYENTGATANEEATLRRLLEVRKRTRGDTHTDVAKTLHALGLACRNQRKYAEAAAYYEQALKIAHESPSIHPQIGAIASNLSIVLDKMGKLGEAEALFTKSVEILEAAVEPEDPALALGLYALAGAKMHQKHYREARQAFLRNIAIQEKAFGAEDAGLAFSLNNMSGALWELGDREGTLRVLRRALAIREKALGTEHELVAMTLDNLALFTGMSGRRETAESLFLRARAIHEKRFGRDSQEFAISLEIHAGMLRHHKRNAEAERLEAEAKAIRAKL